MTIDAGLLSFEDFVHPQPIYAVLSNPKPAKFHTRREPIWRMLQSTHVRLDGEISIDYEFLLVLEFLFIPELLLSV